MILQKNWSCRGKNETMLCTVIALNTQDIYSNSLPRFKMEGYQARVLLKISDMTKEWRAEIGSPLACIDVASDENRHSQSCGRGTTHLLASIRTYP